MKIVLLTLFAVALAQVTPPVWPVRFSQDFVESYSATRQVTVGKVWYDWSQLAMKVSRNDGRMEGICSSVLPNVNGPCIQLVRDQKRYVIHPVQQSCCECCDAAHGCGILRRDWLKEATFKGTQSLNGEVFNKFSIPDGDSMDYYWSTVDSRNIPRKVAEVDSRFKDFILNTYSENPFDFSTF